jgi:hypothetical protein
MCINVISIHDFFNKFIVSLILLRPNLSPLYTMSRDQFLNIYFMISHGQGFGRLTMTMTNPNSFQFFIFFSGRGGTQEAHGQMAIVVSASSREENSQPGIETARFWIPLHYHQVV